MCHLDFWFAENPESHILSHKKDKCIQNVTAKKSRTWFFFTDFPKMIIMTP